MKFIRIADQDLIPFQPVPRRATSGGWTPARQRAFITALAATGSVARAAAAVKMSKAGVYSLRAAEGSEDFVRAWNDAVENGVATLKSIAFERAVDGVEEDVWYQGEKRGSRTRHDNRLLATLLRLYAKPRGSFAPGGGYEIIGSHGSGYGGGQMSSGSDTSGRPEMSREEIIKRLRTMSRRIAAEEVTKERTAAEEARAKLIADEPRLPFDLPRCDAPVPYYPPPHHVADDPDWRNYIDD
jgi:hypothetical protein